MTPAGIEKCIKEYKQFDSDQNKHAVTVRIDNKYMTLYSPKYNRSMSILEGEIARIVTNGVGGKYIFIPCP